MKKCILEVDGKFFLVITALGESVEVEISADIAATLQASGIPLCDE